MKCVGWVTFDIFVNRNGPEWWRLRSEFQKGLSSPSNVRNFLPDTDNITNEFVSKIMDTSVEKEVPDFMLMLLRLNLERKFWIILAHHLGLNFFHIAVLCHLVFDVRMNCFSQDELNPKSRSSELMHAAEVTNSSILPTDQGLQLWRYFETPKYRKLRKAQEFMERFASFI